VAVLPQLIDPGSYRPCDWDLAQDRHGRAYWVHLFCEHVELLLRLIREEYPASGSSRVEAFRHDYLGTMHAVGEGPERHGRVDVLRLTELRRDLLNKHGFPDPFAGLKRRENEVALRLLPDVLADVERLPLAKQWEKLALGLLAGNVFDLGSPATVEKYCSGQLAFDRACADLCSRPWLIDDVQAWQARWSHGGSYGRVLFFADNSGSDIILGCIPFISRMLRHDLHMTLVANSRPALNDVTAPELVALLGLVGQQRPIINDALAQRRLTVVESGSSTPLLDLTAISPECAEAAIDADLVILHGMGRAIEGNWRARFRCDVLRTAVLKDPAVAARLGGRLFDGVFALTPAGEGPARVAVESGKPG